MVRTVLTAGSVLDVASGQVSRADVVLEGDRIAAVGTGLDGDVAVDCAGGTTGSHRIRLTQRRCHGVSIARGW